MSIEESIIALNEKLSTQPALGANLCFDLGEEGQISMEGTATPPVATLDNIEASCTIELSSENLNSLISGTLNPMMAFTTGKLKVQGNMGMAMKLQGIFS